MTPLSLYIHIPFCATRCGYCDFNTYTATELGESVQRDTFHRLLIDEIRLAQARLGDREIATVFIGGGTPTLMGSAPLVELLGAVRDNFPLRDRAEITTEANPETVDEAVLLRLLEAGFTRISLGMQSSSSNVLSVLDRTHTPGRGPAAARAAVDVGFRHVNLDLIYGTPGESDDDVRRSVDDALASGIDHLSAYSLIVEEGTPLARRIARGEIPAPDDDVAARRYELIDDLLSSAGMPWYEVSNWAIPGGECAHNLAYWQDADWWGVGPGAHSHVGGRRWWNHKHPARYAADISVGKEPLAGEESLTDEQRTVERIMLGIRLRQGLPLDQVAPSVVDDLKGRGLVELEGGRVVLTRQGRLLGDAVARDLIG